MQPPLDIQHPLGPGTPASRAFHLQFDATGSQTWCGICASFF
jgi:hypothetical protein